MATTDGGAGEETLMPVVMAEDAATLEEAEAAGTELPDAGLALVGGNTSMASVRAQLVEALEEARDDEGLGDTIERLKGGKFSFLLPMKGSGGDASSCARRRSSSAAPRRWVIRSRLCRRPRRLQSRRRL